MINAIFDFGLANGDNAIGQLFISPVNAPVPYSASIIDSYTLTYNYKGPITASIVPANYAIRFTGRTTTTEFFIGLSSSLDGQTVNANNYIINSAPNINFNAAYAQTSLSASYALTASYVSGSSGNSVSSSYFSGSVISASSVNVNGTITVANGINGVNVSLDENLNVILPSADNSWSVLHKNNPLNNELFSVWDNGNGTGCITINGIHGPYTFNVGGDMGNSAGDYYFGSSFGSSSYVAGNGTYNFGIGFNNPQFTCDVHGDINFIGTLYKNGVVYVPPTSSYALTASYVSGSNISASYAKQSLSASFSITSSNLNGNANANTINVNTLNVNGASEFSGNATFNQPIYSNNSIIGSNGYFDAYLNFYNGGGNWGVYDSTTNNPLLLVNNNTDGTGNVGINTYPGYSLDVNGDIHCSNLYIDTGIIGSNGYLDSNFNLYLPNGTGYNWSIADGSSHKYIFVSTNSNGTANIGINNGSPNFALDVSGSINASGNILTTGNVSASGIIATTYINLPFSSSGHTITPTKTTGSAYFQTTGSVNLLFIFNGTRWTSGSFN